MFATDNPVLGKLQFVVIICLASYYQLGFSVSLVVLLLKFLPSSGVLLKPLDNPLSNC